MIRPLRVVTDQRTQTFSQVIADHHVALARFAFRLCGDTTLAEDVVAEAYAKVWPRWDRGKVDDLAPYLRRAIVNEVYGRRRRWHVEQRHAHRTTERPRSDQFEAGLGERDALGAALDRLPLGQRVTVVLRVVEDLSEQDTAALLGVAPGTVKSRLSRALDALRAELGHETEEDDDA